MTDAPPLRTTIASAATLALASAGCDVEGTPLMLENLCDRSAEVASCQLEGEASFVDGITANALAVRFGPEGGSLILPLTQIPAVVEPTWSLEALVAPEGDGAQLQRDTIDWAGCLVGCPPDIPPVVFDPIEGRGWAPVVEAQRGTSFSSVGEVMMVLRGRSVDLLDLRTPGVDANAATF
ncbi:MAG: hypothetical protein AAGN82_21920 [Myxococcota bacterium]